jgi:hypothetical protein
MKQKIMTLYGHWAGGSCNWCECKTPVEWEIILSMRSIDELLRESNNTEVIDSNFRAHDGENRNTTMLRFMRPDYIFAKTNIRDDKPNVLGKNYYITAMLADKNAPILAISIIGPEEKHIDDIIEQLSTPNMSTTPESKFITYDVNMRKYSGMMNDYITRERGYMQVAIRSIIDLYIKPINAH